MFSFNLTIIVPPIVTLAASDWSVWVLIGQHLTWRSLIGSWSPSQGRCAQFPNCEKLLQINRRWLELEKQKLPSHYMNSFTNASFSLWWVIFQHLVNCLPINFKAWERSLWRVWVARSEPFCSTLLSRQVCLCPLNCKLSTWRWQIGIN